MLFHSYLKKKKKEKEIGMPFEIFLSPFSMLDSFNFFFNLQISIEYHNISYSNESILLILRFFQNRTLMKEMFFDL